jgi:drug/metabolite transporter (DMT)-like permease
VAVALVIMVVWGGTPLFTKIATSEIEPLLVGLLRTVLAGAVALPLVLLMRRGLPPDRLGRQLLALAGGAAYVVFPLLFAFGQHATSAVHGALILATLPVFTSLFGTLLERRRVSAQWTVGCTMALLSTAVIILWRAPQAAGTASLGGDALVLLSSVVCAMGYAAGARLSQRGYPAVSTTLWGTSLSALLLLPGWRGRTRTSNPLIQSQVPCQLGHSPALPEGTQSVPRDARLEPSSSVAGGVYAAWAHRQALSCAPAPASSPRCP